MAWHRLSSSLVLAALSLTGACDEPKSCPSATVCGPRLDIALERPGGEAPPDGSYSVIIDIDGSTHTTTCQVDEGTTTCEDFEGDGRFSVSLDLVLNLGTFAFRVFDGDDNQDEFAPTQVSMRVTSGEEVIADEQWLPTYEHEDQFDGCYQCVIATETLVAVVNE